MTPGPSDIVAYLTRQHCRARVARVTRDLVRRRRLISPGHPNATVQAPVESLPAPTLTGGPPV